VPSFEPDASLWEPWIPAEVAVAMRAAAVEWAVAGGWAIDLYLRETTREHEDIEIVVAPEDFAAVTRAIDLEWLDVGDGCAWPLGDSPTALHQTWAATRRLTAGVSTCFASRGRPATGSFDATAGSGARLRQPLTTIRPVSRISSRSSFSSTRHGNRGKRMRPTSGSQPARSRTQARWLGDALRVIEPDHRWIKRLDELSG
jgi:hypothetical protein